MDPIARVPVEVATRAPEGATNAYVVGTADALLVDPAARHPDLDALVEERSVAHIAVTHHHSDHVGGVAEYAAARDATVWAHAGHEAAFADAAGVAPDRVFRPGTTIPAGADGRGAEVIDTPGHAPEHVAFGVDGAVLTGDLAVAEGSVVVGAPEGDVRAYLASLRRLHARNPDALLPGHGPVIDDPRATLRRLIDHRRERERRVLEAVRSGARSLDEVVDAAYEKDLTGVRDLAAATVAAHLEKLAVEDEVAWDGERAVPR